MNDFDLRVLDAVQKEIPLCARPFEAIARELSRAGKTVGESDVLDALRSLRDAGYIRRMGPVFDAARLGYKSALAAVRAATGAVEEAAAVIGSYAGVTHNYLREGSPYNIWFTVTAESEPEIRRILEEIRTRLGLDGYLLLPSEKTYKIKVGFELGPAGGAEGIDA